MRFAILSALLSTSALAVNVPEVRSLGFSADGATYAFETAWTADGSGFPFRELHVLNVVPNTYAARLRVGGQAYEGRQAALNAEYTVRRTQTLAKYGIGGTRVGTVLFDAALPQPLTYFVPPPAVTVSPRLGAVPVTVRLRETTVPNTCRFTDDASGRTKPVGLLLTVNGRTLQKDTALPAARNCTYGYHLGEIRVWNDRVAILVRPLTPGFEGPDAFPIVVTGLWR
ncbi:DUF2259 domain-containing protein [Deinococcus yavapaiensis]|uniref:Putative secreted protein n=1 Tax=Deinococcus yavapaiensis KR-236 TaxID=694435 RepID=A0A318SEC5_9DEIO|nr:DUF2259 domain-containing protein [Deinococcus yavapaiensis]PYE54862.1 putative secreted protein [Deinococcus yavapaiensis KR-236]